ncbi:hypothetical protein ACLOAV_006999 [Pseudogymnoascus australis]
MPSLRRPDPETQITQGSNVGISWKTLPIEIWSLIIMHLSPIDTCNIMFVNYLFRGLIEDDPKIWTDQHGVPRSSGSLYQTWRSKFQLQASRHKDIIIALNSRLSIFSDDDLSIISSIDKILRLPLYVLWASLKAGDSVLSSSLPTSAYILIEGNCVEKAVSLVRNGMFDKGKEGLVTAAEIANMHGSSLPTTVYSRFVEACVEKAVSLVRIAMFDEGKEGLVMAAEIAEMHGLTLPSTVYSRFVEACVEKAVSLVRIAMFDEGKEGLVTAAEIANMHGSSLPTTVYSRFVEACVEKAVSLARSGSFNSGKGLVMAAEIAEMHGLTLPTSVYSRFEKAAE